jgi:hypothetical protein
MGSVLEKEGSIASRAITSFTILVEEDVMAQPVVALKGGGAQGAATGIEVDDILSGHDKFVAMKRQQQQLVDALEQQVLNALCAEPEKIQTLDEVANKYKDVQVAKEKLVAITNVVNSLESKLLMVVKEAAKDDPETTRAQVEAKLMALEAKRGEDTGWIDQLKQALDEVKGMMKHGSYGQKSPESRATASKA